MDYDDWIAHVYFEGEAPEEISDDNYCHTWTIGNYDTGYEIQDLLFMKMQVMMTLSRRLLNNTLMNTLKYVQLIGHTFFSVVITNSLKNIHS